MKLQKISDIDKLPSVLPIEEVNKYMEQLLRIIKSDKNISSLEGAEAINNLISYQGLNSTGLNNSISLKLFEWIKENYSSYNKDLIESQTANLANLNCEGIVDFLEDRLVNANNEYEINEIQSTIHEINFSNKNL